MSPESHGHLSSVHPFWLHVLGGALDSEPLPGLLSVLRPSGGADATPWEVVGPAEALELVVHVPPAQCSLSEPCTGVLGIAEVL